jgi:hypothetical protein
MKASWIGYQRCPNTVLGPRTSSIAGNAIAWASMAGSVIRKVAGLLNGDAILVTLKFSITQESFDIRRILVERRMIKSFQRRAVNVCLELFVLAVEDVLVQNYTNGDAAVVEWDEPCPAGLVCGRQQYYTMSQQFLEMRQVTQRNAPSRDSKYGAFSRLDPGLYLPAPFQ